MVNILFLPLIVKRKPRLSNNNFIDMQSQNVIKFITLIALVIFLGASSLLNFSFAFFIALFYVPICILSIQNVTNMWVVSLGIKRFKNLIFNLFYFLKTFQSITNCSSYCGITADLYKFLVYDVFVLLWAIRFDQKLCWALRYIELKAVRISLFGQDFAHLDLQLDKLVSSAHLDFILAHCFSQIRFI